jgi:DNA-directed RNA polymerase specialized sigma24 family protein
MMARIDDKDLQKLGSEIEQFSQKHNLTVNEILELLKQQSVPLSIFNDKLSPLETIVKYLKEEQKKTLTQIARILNKKTSVIWLAYNNSKKKYPKKLQHSPDTLTIPIDKLYSKKMSLLERICVYMKDHHRLNYHKIGLLLKRDERTIWTIYQRAKKRT